MADIVDVLAFKLQSKICYHRDANLDYLEIKAMVDKLVEENKKFRDEKMEYLDMINTVIEEKEKLQHDYDVIKEQLAPMEEQLETVNKDLMTANEQLVAAKHENAAVKHEHVVATEELMTVKEQLVAAKHENAAEKHEHVVAKEELVVAKEQLARKTKELNVLRKKLQESEAMHAEIQQQKRSALGPETVHFRRVTRSSHEHVAETEELVVAEAKLAGKNEELEDLRKKLQESEAKDTHLRQRKRNAPGPEPENSRRLTRSTYQRERLLSEIV